MELLPSGLPNSIDLEEDIARFLTQSSHYNSVAVKPVAFLPEPRSRETSVSRHGRDPAWELWKLGREAAGTRNLHGAAMFKAKDVADAELTLAPAEPPPRHAVVRGWPWDENDAALQKAHQKEKALVLASRSELLLAPIT